MSLAKSASTAVSSRKRGIEIREMNSGCICCSLVGDFGTALREVIDQYHPDRIIIEPSE